MLSKTRGRVYNAKSAATRWLVVYLSRLESCPPTLMEALDHKLLLEQFDLKRKSRQIAVSVDDVEVKSHLRDLNEPICK